MPITTVLDLPKNEAGLVDKYIGTAFDVVYAVYKDLDTIDNIPSDLIKYGRLKDAMDANVVSNTASQSAIAESVNSNTNILNVINDLHNDTITQNSSAVAASNTSKDTLEQVKQTQADVITTYNDTLTLKNTTNDLTNESKGYRDQLVNQIDDLQSKYSVIIDKVISTNSFTHSLDASKLSRSGDTVTGDFAVLGNTNLAQLKVNTMFRLVSPNEQLVVDTHADDTAYRQYLSRDGGQSWKLLTQGDANFNLYADSGYALINGNKLVDFAHMGAGSGVDADTVDGLHGSDLLKQSDIAALNTSMQDQLKGLLDTKFDKTGGDIQGIVNAQVLKTGAFSTYNDAVYINYGGRQTFFQNDGNLVNYGTDGSPLTTLKDGAFWTKGSIISSSTIAATAMLHVQSFNGQTALDIHTDDDGVIRMYAKNFNTDAAQFLAINPEYNLDFNTPTGVAFINGHRIFAQNFMGAGSGLDADTFRGTKPTDYISADTGNQLQYDIKGRVLNYPKDDGADSPLQLLSYNASKHLHYWCKEGDFDVANLSDLNNYLPLTGGTLSGSLYVQSMLRVTSFNGETITDIHTDDDGLFRIYCSNANSSHPEIAMQFNPQGNFDTYAPNGDLLVNGLKVAHMGNMGSGSGFDADSVDGLHGEDLAKQSDNNSIWNTLNNDCLRTSVGMDEGALPVLGLHISKDGNLMVVAKDKNGKTRVTAIM